MEFFDILNILSDTSIGKVLSFAVTVIGLGLTIVASNPIQFIFSGLVLLLGLAGLVLLIRKDIKDVRKK